VALPNPLEIGAEALGDRDRCRLPPHGAKSRAHSGHEGGNAVNEISLKPLKVLAPFGEDD
jgi:hypothetical protein